MPNKAVRAAAGDLPITRRTLMAAVATVAIPAAPAEARVHDRKLAELMADFLWIEQEFKDCLLEFGQLERSTAYEQPLVQIGRQFIIGYDGNRHDEPIFAHTHDEIDSNCDRMRAFKTDDERRSMEQIRRAKHDELQAIQDRNHVAAEASGLVAAESRVDALGDRLHQALMAVLRFRPVRIDEYQMRDAFIADYLRTNGYLDIRELDAIFGVVSEDANVEWVRAMRADGFTFELIGTDAGDLNSYSITRRPEAVDSSGTLMAVLKKGSDMC